MNAEIFAALAQLEKERGIPQSYMIDKITQALVAAYKKDKDGYTDNVFVEIQDNDMKMYVQKEVVDDVLTPATEISLDAAQKIDKHAQLGDLVNVDVKTQAFGRIAAQTAKQVIIQGIREAERGMVFDTFSSKEHEILTGTVLRVEPMSGDMIVRIGGGTDRTDAMLAASEQVNGEPYKEGDHDPRLRGRGAQKHPRPAGHRLPHASGPRQAPL
jgi:N utilization substance protein A